MHTNEELAAFLKKQISLVDWFKQIGHKDAEELHKEDKTKTERLTFLHEQIGLPFDKPRRFLMKDVVDRSEEFSDYFEKHKDVAVAFRLLPLREGLQKLRTRGSTLKVCVEEWWGEQGLNAEDYMVDITIHPQEYSWSTIFILGDKGVVGEAVAESHQLLTQGFYDKVEPLQFSYDFHSWKLSREEGSEGLLEHLKELIGGLLVSDEEKKRVLVEKLECGFSHNYLKGYFETVCTERGTLFIDYNRLLPKYYEEMGGLGKGKEREDLEDLENFGGEGVLTGTVAYAGKAKGKVRIVNDPLTEGFSEGDILVCEMTSPDYLPLMKKASGIITDKGGILTHAAIVARELKKPCLVGVKRATQVLKEGGEVLLDGEKGIVRKI